MIYFLFVPVESGKPEMAALESTRVEDAVREAEALPFAGRTGYLFDGDHFIREIRTAHLMRQAPLPATQFQSVTPSPRSADRSPRPG